MWSKVHDRWLARPIIDLVGAALITLANLVVSLWLEGRFDFLGQMNFADRMSLYTDLITISGIFVGFSATALAAYLALPGQSVERLREVANEEIIRQWLAAIGGSAAVLLIFVVCKVADRDGAVPWVHWVAEFAFVFLVLRASRMIYVFSRLVAIATAPKYERRRREGGIAVKQR